MGLFGTSNCWELRPRSGCLLELGFIVGATGINKLWVSFGQLIVGNYGRREVAAFLNWATGVNKWVTISGQPETSSTAFFNYWCINKLWVSFAQLLGGTTAAKRSPSYIRRFVPINGSLLLGKWNNFGRKAAAAFFNYWCNWHQ